MHVPMLRRAYKYRPLELLLATLATYIDRVDWYLKWAEVACKMYGADGIFDKISVRKPEWGKPLATFWPRQYYY